MDLPSVLSVLSSGLGSVWLLPVLILMIAVDGPLPMLPSETVLMSAVATATVSHDLPMLTGLFLAAGVGSVLGDLAAYGLGRGSHRLLAARAADRHGVTRWVRANLFRRPVAALAAARFVPGGRLASTAASGRLGLPLRAFLAGSAVSSLLWSVYMLVVGLVLGPVTGGNPLLCVAAGGVMAVLTGGGFAVGHRIRSRRRPVAAAPAREPALAAD